jgi:hypothetical protein
MRTLSQVNARGTLPDSERSAGSYALGQTTDRQLPHCPSALDTNELTLRIATELFQLWAQNEVNPTRTLMCRYLQIEGMRLLLHLHGGWRIFEGCLGACHPGLYQPT